MESIFQNIIDNALKYGQKSFHVSVTSKQETVNIVFQNKAKDLSIDTTKIFEKFYTEDMARTGKGTGLGLAIVRDLTEANNGTISAEFTDNYLIFTLQFNQVSK